jgi:hypothetical protein
MVIETVMYLGRRSRVELGGARLKAFHTGPTAVGCRVRVVEHLNASIYSSAAPRIDQKYLSDPQKYICPLGQLGTACDSLQLQPNL